MEKLYGLQVIKDEGSWREFIAFSHSKDKLHMLVQCSGSWTNFGLNGGYDKSSTDKDVYPLYIISEVSFVV